MQKTPFIIALIGLTISFISVRTYAEDKKYYLDERNSQWPNYNDPSKPNYMRGTRTDMAPKVDVDHSSDQKRSDDDSSKSVVSEYKPSNKSRAQAEREQMVLEGEAKGIYRSQEEEDVRNVDTGPAAAWDIPRYLIEKTEKGRKLRGE